MKVKHNVTILSIVLIVVLIILTFVSRTIYHNSLPLVTAVSAKHGYLNLSTETTGKITYPDAKKLSSTGEWLVSSVKVKDGDKVSKGDILCNFDTRASDINIQTLELGVLSQKATLEILRKNSRKSRSASRISMNEALNKQLDNDTYQQVITSTQLSIAQAQLDLAISQAPPSGGMIAPIDGVVYGVSVKTGDTTTPGMTIMKIIPKDARPALTFKLPSDTGGSYGTGSKVEGMLQTMISDKKIKYQQESVIGVVMNRVLRGVSWEYQVDLDALKGQPLSGQDVPIKVSNQISEDGEYIIPIGCLFADGNGGKCIYAIDERKGLFGTEYYLTDQTVDVVADNGKSALVKGSIDTSLKLANKPSRPITSGSVVSTRNY